MGLTMSNYILLYLALLLTLLSCIPANGQSHCYSSIKISVESHTDVIDLDGFTLRLNGQFIGITNGLGEFRANINDIRDLTSGTPHTVTASRGSYNGQKSININCIDPNNNREFHCRINVRLSTPG